MKKIFRALLLLACLSAPSWAQCAQLQVIPTEPFDAIEISGSADVRFTQGPRPRPWHAGSPRRAEALRTHARRRVPKLDE